jgi:hypothetical protein
MSVGDVYDALHLACAMTVCDTLRQHGLSAPVFVAADDTLLEAASTEDFVVENPLLHS